MKSDAGGSRRGQRVNAEERAMTHPRSRFVYGPVPSRRLGRSLGVDLVPLKTCTYDCIYCQLGRTRQKTLERMEHVRNDEVLEDLSRALQSQADHPASYIALAGSGEPTLHSGLGELISGIKGLTPIPVAVITNGSLLWKREVQEALMQADLLLPSLDAGDADLFEYVNRPHRGVCFDQLVGGLAEFTSRFPGEVWLEVLLLGGVTGILSEVKKIAALARQICPNRVQLGTVTRPPAEEYAYPVSGRLLNLFAPLFDPPAEIITPYQGTTPAGEDLACTDEDILALIRRRPCTLEDVGVGLGMHVAEVVKRMEVLVRIGKARRVATEHAIFFESGP